MNIVHLDHGREMRGGQFQVLHLLHGLRDRGHVNILLARRGSPLMRAAKADGFDVRPLNLFSLWTASVKADIVHAHEARAHSFAAVAARVPFIVARRVAFPLRRGLFSRLKYARASHFIAVSHFVAAQLRKAGIGTDRISVIHDGVALPAVPAPWSESRIVALATNDPNKGADLVREAATRAGVTVQFSDNLGRDLPGAALFVYLSRSEGLGSAVLLAMAHKVAVIASNVDGLPETVQDGETGLLVANDPAGVAEAISRLMADLALRRRMGDAGLRRVCDHFSLDRMVDQTLALYGDMVRSSRPAGVSPRD
jgi:glycosyltransferase involved in cell wall biosynthesis